MNIKDLRKGIIGFFILIVFFISIFQYSIIKAGSLEAPENADYQAYPPFMVNQDQLLPNLLVVFDNSQYMGYPAYCKLVDANGNLYDDTARTGFNQNYEYVGFFNNRAFYRYRNPAGVGGQVRWSTSGTIGQVARPPDSLPGNLLNWALMSKWDVLKTVTVGGPVSNFGQGNDSEAIGFALNNLTWTCTGTWTDPVTNISTTFTFSVKGGGTNKDTEFTVTSSPKLVTSIQNDSKVSYAINEEDKSKHFANNYLNKIKDIFSLKIFDINLASAAVSNITPSSGPSGTTIVITGSDFGNSANKVRFTMGATTVTVPVDNKNWSQNQVTVLVPEGLTPGTYTVTVLKKQGSNDVDAGSGTFTVRAMPVLGTILPNKAPVGTSITASGTNLGTAPGTIIIENTATPPAVITTIIATPNATGTEVTFLVPSTLALGNYNIKWRNSTNDVSNGLPFEVIQATANPIIYSINPSSGSVGESITIYGNNFGNKDTADDKVFFGTAEANVVSWNNTTIVVTVPSLSSGTYNVVVQNRVGGVLRTSKQVSFSIIPTGTAGPFSVRVYYPYNPWGVVQELYMNDYDTANPTWKTDVPIPGFMNHNGIIGQGANRACINTTTLSPRDFIKAVRESTLTTNSPLYTTLDRAIKYYSGNSSVLSSIGCADPLLNSQWCRKNFILLVGSGKTDDGTKVQLEELVRDPHTNDIRPDIQNVQNINFYTVSVSGVDDFRQNLKAIADFGGFTDKNSNKQPEDGEYNSKRRANRNIDFEPNNRYKPFIPDTYFEPGGSVYDLGDQIKEAVSEILQRATSGTAVSVLATSAEGEGALFQAFFRPIHFEATHSVSWLGYLQALFIDPYGNIRADTDRDKKLKLLQDDIIQLSFDSATGDTVAQCFKDANGDGKPDTTTPYQTLPLSEVPTLWEAGKILANTHPSDRNIFTTINGTESGRVSFAPSNAATLQTLLRTDTLEEAQDFINFVRGEDLSDKNYRERKVTIDGSTRVWKLADIVYSTPTVVSAPSENYDLIYGDKSYFNFYNTYKNRKAVIYVGSNDGLLHAFSAGNFNQGDDGTGTSGYFTDPDNDMGKELWAFIPRSFLPHIEWQTKKAYKHVYGIDLKVKVVDVEITKGGSKQWATVLIGGMRLGGGPISAGGETIYPSYFALDITNPTSPQILWEFSHPNLGMTLGYPAVVKKGTKWYAIFGSGPNHSFTDVLYHDNNGYRAKSNQTAKFFIVDIDNKTSWQLNTNYWIKDTNISGSFIGNPVSLDVDLIVDSTKGFESDVVYAGVVQGLYVSTQRGYVVRLLLNNDDPAQWPIRTVFESAGYRPLVNAPAVSVRDRDLWIYISSGRFLHTIDKTIYTSADNKQKLYGFKDPCFNGNFISTCTTTLRESNLVDVTSVVVKIDGTVSGTGSVAGTPTNWNSLKSAIAQRNGWMMTLETSGERGVAKPALIGDIVLFTTYLPTADICSAGGFGYMYALYSLTGTAYIKPVIGYNTADSTIFKRTAMGTGTPSSISIHMGRQKGGRAYVQQSTGAIMNVEFQTAARAKSGFVLWREKW